MDADLLSALVSLHWSYTACLWMLEELSGASCFLKKDIIDI